MGGFLLVGLAGFGITGVLTSIGTNTVARVGGRDITKLDFQRAYNQQLNAAARQMGTIPTPKQALSLGIPGNVLNQLATDQVLNMLSDRFGLGISDQRLTELLQKDPNFAGAIGKFSRMVFDRMLRQNRYTEADFFKIRRQAAERQQVALGIFAQVRTPETVLKLMRHFAEDRRTLEYFVVSPDSLLPIAAPTDTVLQAYLKENQARYRTREARKIRIMELSPQILAQTYTVSDAQVAAEYQRTRDRLVKPERRTIAQVILPDAATVKKFEQGLKDGVSYDTLVKEAGLTSTKIGTFAENEIANLNLAQTSFDLEKGEFAIIAGAEGKRAITVTAIEPGGPTPLKDVAAQLAQKLKMDKARPAYNDMLDKIDEQRAAFTNMSKIASQFNLKVIDITIEAKGTKLIDALGITAQQAGKIATTIFNTEVNKLVPSIPLGSAKTVWFDLVSVDGARYQTLNEVRDKLSAAWIAGQRAKALREKADQLLAQVKGGQSLADVAVANAMFPRTSQPVSRTGDGSGVIDAKVASAAFGGGIGYEGAVQNDKGDYVVFKVKNIEKANKPLNAKSKDFIVNGYRNDIYSGFANSLRQDAPLSINQKMLNQLLGLNSGQ